MERMKWKWIVAYQEYRSSCGDSKVDTSRRALIAMLSREVKRSKKGAERVRKRVPGKLCLMKLREVVDGKEVEVDCDRPAGQRRAVCKRCYGAVMREMSRLPASEAVELEQQYVFDGYMLAAGETARMNAPCLAHSRRA